MKSFSFSKLHNAKREIIKEMSSKKERRILAALALPCDADADDVVLRDIGRG